MVRVQRVSVGLIITFLSSQSTLTSLLPSKASLSILTKATLGTVHRHMAAIFQEERNCRFCDYVASEWHELPLFYTQSKEESRPAPATALKIECVKVCMLSGATV